MSGRQDDNAQHERSEPLLLGSSSIMQAAREQIAMVAAFPWPVRIEGPTGSGKNVAARLLHALSAVHHGPFVVCSLATLPDGMEVRELVGHRRGAFTTAVESQIGAFEMAHRGTLFLDEIATASPAAQKALLQLVDTQRFRRLGDQRDIQVQVRLVFATNADLERMVETGSLRHDLYYRMGPHVISMPALKEHPEDIPELVARILETKSREIHRPAPSLSNAELDQLMRYEWPGNVRELEKTMEHYLVCGRLPERSRRSSIPDWRERVDAAMAQHGGNKSAAARTLGVARSQLYAELKRRVD